MGADKPAPGAQPLQVDEGLRKSLRAAGASPQDIEAVVAERGAAKAKTAADEEAEAFAVEPDNWDNWLIFLSVSTQWVWASFGMGGAARVALNLPGVESGLRMQGIKRKRWPAVFADLRVIEQAVLVAENEMRARTPRGKPPRQQRGV